MRKVVAILSAILVMMSVASCKKSSPLAGTTWTCVMSEENENGVFSINSTIKFQETTFTLSLEATGPDAPQPMSMNGTYTYKAPTVTLTADKETMTATINGNVLTIADPDLGTLEYKKLLK